MLVTDVWPCNWRAWQVFLAMRTQWRLLVGGMGGVVWAGLDYQVLPVIERRLGVKKKQRGDVFGRLQVLETAALEELNRK